MAVGVLRDGSPVIASGDDGTVWRLADGTLLAHPLDLSEPVWGLAVHGNIIVTAVGGDIAIHHRTLHDPYEICFLFSGLGRSTRPSDNGRLSGTSAGEPLARTSAVTESEHPAERNNRTFGV